jgi:hypothetical protein
MRVVSVTLMLALLVCSEGFANRFDSQPPIPREPVGRPSEDAQTIIKRIKTHLSATEKRLEGKDPGAETHELQERIIKDLEKLLDPPSDGKSDTSDKSSSNRPRIPRSTSRDDKNAEPTGSFSKDGRKGDGVGTDHKDPSKAPVVSEVRREAWGDLLRRKRPEMDAYGKDARLPKYERILDRYYRTIAEETKRRDQE